MRPTHPWLEQYPADLFLVDWLEAERLTFDVITDEDLHREGVDLLAQYRCVMTGTHPEYYTTPMWDGLQSYLQTGGRMMYMGGNGFVWRIGMLPAQRGAIELRRGEASFSIGANEPGEYYMASTGEIWGPVVEDRPGTPDVGGRRLRGTGFRLLSLLPPLARQLRQARSFYL